MKEEYTEEVWVFSKTHPLAVSLVWEDENYVEGDVPLMSCTLWMDEHEGLRQEFATHVTNIDARETKKRLTELANLMLSEFEKETDNPTMAVDKLASRLAWMNNKGDWSSWQEGERLSSLLFSDEAGGCFSDKIFPSARSYETLTLELPVTTWDWIKCRADMADLTVEEMTRAILVMALPLTVCNQEGIQNDKL